MFCCFVDRGAINSPFAAVGCGKWNIACGGGFQVGCHSSGTMTVVWVAHGHNISCQRQTILAQKKTPKNISVSLWPRDNVMGKQNKFTCRQTLKFGLVGSVPAVSSHTQRKRLITLLPQDLQASCWHQAWEKQSRLSLLLPLRCIQASQGWQALSLVDCLRQVEQDKAFSWNKLYMLSLERCHTFFFFFFPLIRLIFKGDEKNYFSCRMFNACGCVTERWVTWCCCRLLYPKHRGVDIVERPMAKVALVKYRIFP